MWNVCTQEGMKPHNAADTLHVFEKGMYDSDVLAGDESYVPSS